MAQRAEERCAKAEAQERVLAEQAAAAAAELQRKTAALTEVGGMSGSAVLCCAVLRCRIWIAVPAFSAPSAACIFPHSSGYSLLLLPLLLLLQAESATEERLQRLRAEEEGLQRLQAKVQAVSGWAPHSLTLPA